MPIPRKYLVLNLKKTVWWVPIGVDRDPIPRQILTTNQRLVSDSGGVPLRCRFTAGDTTMRS
jgi:hypothetical protein